MPLPCLLPSGNMKEVANHEKGLIKLVLGYSQGTTNQTCQTAVTVLTSLHHAILSPTLL